MAFDVRNSRAGISGERIAAALDAARATFGFPAGIAMGIGLLLGLGLPELDDWLDASVPLFVFSTQDAARGMLETIATAAMAVAGISISVTIVAFTLSANQLSPRVLRSFRRDLISQLTLAAFLGTFIYCLAVLVRLGSLGPDRVPTFSIAVAVLLALLAFGLFATFIGHIANMLQPSTIIASIAADAEPELDHPYPAGIGAEAEDVATARSRVERQISARVSLPVRSEGGGFLTIVGGDPIVAVAAERDLLVRQRTPVGAYVLPGEAVAEAWIGPGADSEGIAERLASCFELGRQRTLPQDPGFPIRQLADVALKGLSPGINDPTTASNAIEGMTAGLVRFARSPQPSAIRLDDDGVPRFVAEVADLDGLVALGFDQVRVFADSDPTVLALLRDLLSRLRAVAVEQGRPHAAIDRLLAG